MKTIQLLLLLLVLVSCNNGIPSTGPDVGALDDLNQSIDLTVPKGWNTFKTTDSVTLQITNISKDSLLFDSNYGIRMFVYKDDSWVEIMDGLKNFYQDPIRLQPYNGDATTTGVVSVLPKLEDRTKGVWLRIYIIGETENEVNVDTARVGAYIDVFLKP